MVGYINNADVFMRTKLGSKELASRENATIPREARTLLILIDGRKSYAQIAKSLEQRKLYQRTNGVREYMQTLIDLEYVICKPTRSNNTRSNNSRTKTSIATASKGVAIDTGTALDKAGRVKLVPEKIVSSNSALRSTVTGTQAVLSSDSSTVSSHQTIKKPTAATESLREIVSSLIAKHAQAKQAKIYNKRLAKCQDMRAIFELIQEMQRASSDEFEVALYLTALAFKKSKIVKPRQTSAM